MSLRIKLMPKRKNLMKKWELNAFNKNHWSPKFLKTFGNHLINLISTHLQMRNSLYLIQWSNKVASKNLSNQMTWSSLKVRRPLILITPLLNNLMKISRMLPKKKQFHVVISKRSMMTNSISSKKKKCQSLPDLKNQNTLADCSQV